MAVVALPRFIALQSSDEKDFLGYVRDGGESYEYLRFMETEATSPYARFEVKTSSKDGQLVHIRSSQNNKYFVRTKNLSITGNPAEQYWITASADQPEEDQSKESCTLFKPISVDLATNTVRIMHVQSGCYLCVWRLSVRGFTRPVLANYQIYDHQSCDIFTYVALEGNDEPAKIPRFFSLQSNDKNDSLGYMEDCASYGYLCFMRTRGVNPLAKFEVENATDTKDGGFVHIRSSVNNKYWVRIKDNYGDDYWIAATADKPEEDRTKPTCTLFRAVPVDPSANTVRFMHVQSECFLCAWPWEAYRCVLANFKAYDANNRDVFTVIDSSSAEAA